MKFQNDCGVEKHLCNLSQSCYPRTFLSGAQVRVRLDSPLKHAGMTDSYKPFRSNSEIENPKSKIGN
jgi:hypothetical protein